MGRMQCVRSISGQPSQLRSYSLFRKTHLPLPAMLHFAHDGRTYACTAGVAARRSAIRNSANNSVQTARCRAVPPAASRSTRAAVSATASSINKAPAPVCALDRCDSAERSNASELTRPTFRGHLRRIDADHLGQRITVSTKERGGEIGLDLVQEPNSAIDEPRIDLHQR